MTTIAVSLISHTNAGKTTLARTLLGMDVGEVEDAPHVTTEAASFPLLTSPEGDVLMLWDTPGFGNSKRLASRLAQHGSPIGWFLAQVWDRFKDRSFWLTQLAVHNVRDHADVALYLVNASESPANAGYLAAEMALLKWLEKPVIVVLNQTGAAHSQTVEAEHINAWHEALQQYPQVRDVLTLDAFARCWVQEYTLFQRLRRVLPLDRKAALERLTVAWEAGQWARFNAAMTVLARPIATAACARVPVPPRPRLRWLGDALGLNRRDPKEGFRASTRALARILVQQLESEQRASASRLLAIYGLQGEASADLAARLESDFVAVAPVDEGQAAAIGGILSGATTGLAADLAAGGLTLGGGMLAGAVLGAFAGVGIARGLNVVRGEKEASIRWGTAFLDSLVVTALLRYLAVAHFGRGRGDWQDSACLPVWRSLVEQIVAGRRSVLADIWAQREPDGGAVVPASATTSATDLADAPVDVLADTLADALATELHGMARKALNELYPDVLPSLQDGG